MGDESNDVAVEVSHAEEFIKSFNNCTSLDAFLTVLDEMFVNPEAVLVSESNREVIAKDLVNLVVQKSLCLDTFLDAVLFRRREAKNTTFLVGLFTSASIKKNQELVRALCNLLMAEIALVLEENTLLVKLREYLFEPLLLSVREEEKPVALMATVKAINMVACVIRDARNIAVDPTTAPLRDEVIVALLGLIAAAIANASISTESLTEAKKTFSVASSHIDQNILSESSTSSLVVSRGSVRPDYSISDILDSISSLLSIKRLSLSSSVFGKILEISLQLVATSPVYRSRRVSSVCACLRVLTDQHARSWTGVTKILHSVVAGGGHVDLFLAVCSCAPKISVEKTSEESLREYVDSLCLSLALFPPPNAAPAAAASVKTILRAGNFSSFSEAVKRLPNSIVGYFCELIISRDCDFSLVLKLLRIRAKDLPDYFSSKLITLIFSKNRKYYDCLQYIATIHLETTLRRILEKENDDEELDLLKLLTLQKSTFIQSIHVLTDLLGNTDPSYHWGFRRISFALKFFLCLDNEYSKREIARNFSDLFSFFLVNFGSARERMIDCLIAISPSSEFSEFVIETGQLHSKNNFDEFPFELARKFSNFVNIPLVTSFLERKIRTSEKQRVCAAAILSSLNQQNILLESLLLSDSNSLVRKYAARSLPPPSEGDGGGGVFARLISCINSDRDPNGVVVRECFLNLARVQPVLSVEISSVDKKLIEVLENFEDAGESVAEAAIELIARLRISDISQVHAKLLVLVILRLDSASFSHLTAIAIQSILKISLKFTQDLNDLTSCLQEGGGTNQQNLFSLVSTLVKENVLTEDHLKVCKDICSDKNIDTAQPYIIGTLSILTGRLTALLEPNMSVNDERRLVLQLINFACQLSYPTEVRTMVVLALQEFARLDRTPWIVAFSGNSITMN